ncbi:xanthine/uracil permease [Mycena amicta]|nr:xanthine/uracil permease [Mycena amicta]
MSTATDQQPAPSPRPSMLGRAKEKVTTRHGWLGDYDYAWSAELCTPTLPFGNLSSKSRQPPFYALHEEMPLILAISTGLQHALAMLAGLITPPIIFASALSLDARTSAYMISASLIGCGLLSLVQMSRIKLFGGYYLGTGLISVVGTSFATLSTANAIFDAMYADGTCPSSTAADGTVSRLACPEAYGKLLGTSLICSLLEIGMAFVPIRVLRRVFPPLVTGTVILTIGASLIGSSGIPNWGGGSNSCSSRPTSGIFELCPTIFAPRPLPWGSPEFIGLGFLSFVTIILTEMFGSPFLKNTSIIVGLLVGSIVASAAGYADRSTIDSAPAITFLWVHTFKIGVYGPAVLPMLAVYVSLAMEAIGDITASAEVSRQPVDGEVFDSRIQGGVLSDGIGGFLSALFTVTPLSIFAQSLPAAGAGTVLRLPPSLGILGKVAGALLAIPNPVLGGVTTFLFASVAVSGVRVLGMVKWGRRERFVLAAALSFGFGDLLVPGIFTHLFEGVDNPSKALQGWFGSMTIVLSTPFLSAGIVAALLNGLLPHDTEPATADDDVIEDVEVVEHGAPQQRSSSAEGQGDEKVEG